MRGPTGCIVLGGLRDVLLHQLRQHLVLALELLLQSRDPLRSSEGRVFDCRSKAAAPFSKKICRSIRTFSSDVKCLRCLSMAAPS